MVTVGTYDGVHLGHRRLIATACKAAQELGLKGVVVTFDRHPSEVLRPEAPVPLLTSLQHKLELIRSTGVARTEVLAFDDQRALESAEDFIASVLVGVLGAKVIVVGSNFRFGHGRHGDMDLLEKMGAEYDFRSLGVELVLDDETHTVVSSTRIRALVTAGEFAEATRLLGRPHEVRGRLRVGSDNVSLDLDGHLLLPAPGTYRATVGDVHADGQAQQVDVALVGDQAELVIGPAADMARFGFAHGDRAAVRFLPDGQDHPAGR